MFFQEQRSTSFCTECGIQIFSSGLYCKSCSDKKVSSDETMPLSEHMEAVANELPALMGKAVLIDPKLRKQAQKEIELQIFIRTDPEISKGMKPINIIDFTADDGEKMKKIISRWMNPNILSHKVDVLELFPKWAMYVHETTGGERISILSPIVTIDSETVFFPVQQTLTWLAEQNITGVPEAIIVIPKDWVDSDIPGAACATGQSLFISYEDIVDDGLAGYRNIPRHEVNHTAVDLDPKMGDSASRTMVEGIAMTLEILQSGENAQKYIQSLMDGIVGINPDITNVSGFSSKKTYKTNNIKKIDGRYINPDGVRRQMEYIQGIILCNLILETFGIDALKKVYSCATTKFFITEEQLIGRAIKKGLSFSRSELSNFKREYLELCNKYLTTSRKKYALNE